MPTKRPPWKPRVSKEKLGGLSCSGEDTVSVAFTVVLAHGSVRTRARCSSFLRFLALPLSSFDSAACRVSAAPSTFVAGASDAAASAAGASASSLRFLEAVAAVESGPAAEATTAGSSSAVDATLALCAGCSSWLPVAAILPCFALPTASSARLVAGSSPRVRRCTRQTCEISPSSVSGRAILRSLASCAPARSKDCTTRLSRDRTGWPRVRRRLRRSLRSPRRTQRRSAMRRSRRPTPSHAGEPPEGVLSASAGPETAVPCEFRALEAL